MRRIMMIPDSAAAPMLPLLNPPSAGYGNAATCDSNRQYGFAYVLPVVHIQYRTAGTNTWYRTVVPPVLCALHISMGGIVDQQGCIWNW